MRYTFGQAFAYEFYPQDTEGNSLEPSADAPVVRLYDEQPTRAEVLAGIGSIVQTVSSWTTIPHDGKSVAFDAVQDPEPESSQTFRNYWVGTTFTLAVSGQAQVFIQRVILSRAVAQSSRVSVTPADIKKICPRLFKFLTHPKVEEYIEQAFTEMKMRFESDGKKWAYLQEVNEFNLVLSYKTIQLAFESRTGEKYEKIAATYEKKYNDLIGTVIAPYDLEGDGDSEVVQQQASYTLAIR